MERHVAGWQMKCTVIKSSKPSATNPGTYSNVALIFRYIPAPNNLAVNEQVGISAATTELVKCK